MEQPLVVDYGPWLSRRQNEEVWQILPSPRNPVRHCLVEVSVVHSRLTSLVFLSGFEAHFTRRAFSCALSAVCPGYKVVVIGRVLRGLRRFSRFGQRRVPLQRVLANAYVHRPLCKCASVAVLAAGAKLRATPDWVPRGIRPFNFACDAHFVTPPLLCSRSVDSALMSCKAEPPCRA